MITDSKISVRPKMYKMKKSLISLDNNEYIKPDLIGHSSSNVNFKAWYSNLNKNKNIKKPDLIGHSSPDPDEEENENNNEQRFDLTGQSFYKSSHGKACRITAKCAIKEGLVTLLPGIFGAAILTLGYQKGKIDTMIEAIAKEYGHEQNLPEIITAFNNLATVLLAASDLVDIPVIGGVTAPTLAAAITTLTGAAAIGYFEACKHYNIPPETINQINKSECKGLLTMVPGILTGKTKKEEIAGKIKDIIIKHYEEKS